MIYSSGTTVYDCLTMISTLVIPLIMFTWMILVQPTIVTTGSLLYNPSNILTDTFLSITYSVNLASVYCTSATSEAAANTAA